MKRFEGKVVVITGGSRGIGLATAQLFIKEGSFVFITGRHETELAHVARLLGENAIAFKGDVSDLATLDRLYALVKEKKGHIDILFANAGHTEYAHLGKISEEHFDKLFNINVKGILFTVQKALPLLQEGSSVILNASRVSCMGMEAFSVYTATKAAVRSFARTWTMDLKVRNIRVNAISPGPILTPGIHHLSETRQQPEKVLENLVAQVPLGRMGKPEEVAQAVAFLASEESSFIAGSELFVDGGSAQV